MTTPETAFPFATYAATCAGVCVAFQAVWWFAKTKDNWSLVDVAWTLSVPLAAIVPVWSVAGFSVRACVMLAALTVWGVRLGSHLHGRVSGGRDREDPRYAEMRERWGARTPLMMAGFYQLQAVVVWVLLLPAFLVSGDGSAYPHVADIAGIVIAVAGIVGESAADAQLRRFKADKSRRGAICDTGLWAWSRHPNYFFECVFWTGVAVAALPAPAGFFAVLAPATITWLLVRVTGVKLAEERAERTKGDAWRDYARRVPMFIPTPPRHS